MNDNKAKNGKNAGTAQPQNTNQAPKAPAKDAGKNGAKK